MMFTRLSTLAIACMVSTTTFAFQSAQAPNQLELGLEYGKAEQEYSRDGYSGDNTGDENGYRIFGTYYFNSNMGIRIGYANFGEAETYSEDFWAYVPEINNDVRFRVEDISDAKALTFGAVVSTPITQGPFELWGEVGLARWDVEVNSSLSAPDYDVQVDAVKDSDSDISIYGGFGVRFQANEQFGLGISALWYTMEPDLFDETWDLQVQVISFNGSFRF